ncbi:GNAT family N-acetyltransferase [Pedobacter rhizosphaerae]|uniref:Acetyltransferase (GNAT) family protein n=1 Tax=Pedobacter rhizosphaerae TaxID=390241 RepID=A0A1H9VHC3_9SPHI|nr:GNAT family N-acetyltransferase [Pedobacter rhizosphaerae]SES21052.1 Acetyltransferase (GNAT) family protein [Pedobacter rhizosphaerae]
MIRKAKQEDAPTVAELIVQAMGDLAYKFSNTRDHHKTLALFEHFFRLTDNQYSYQHTLVYKEGGEVLGSINGYDGSKLAVLRAPFLQYLKEHCGWINFDPEPETAAGEFYLDTISVAPIVQGKGIGKQLIEAGINRAAELGHKNVGLLVELNNPGALRLYQKMGFEIESEKTFINGLYYHMTQAIE